ncbi:hypothetical protein [Corynebacterium crudilactis]|uniref:Uncharacterized protein n=1 Tax=Corynebacterium crudilactis TaxID=1652495 RepID=A0A172QQJ4_9CORY|nr:hypothetical protein ccrud_01025 [Corynebacterium crudilactis]
MRMQVAAGSALIGAGVAVNDYVQSPVARAVGYGSLVLSGAAVVAMGQDRSGEKYLFSADSATMVDQIRQEIGDLGVTPGPESDVDAITERGPLVTWLLLAVFIIAFVALVYLSVRLDLAVMKKLAGFFEKRGASRPFTCTGMVYAAAVYAIFELEERTK